MIRTETLFLLVVAVAVALAACGCASAGGAADAGAARSDQPAAIGSPVMAPPFAVSSAAAGTVVETRQYPPDALRTLHAAWFAADTAMHAPPRDTDHGVEADSLEAATARLWALMQRVLGPDAFRSPACCLRVDTGADGEPTAIRLVAPAGTHDAVAQLLQALTSQQPDRVVHAEARLVQLRAADVPALGLNLQRIGGNLWGCTVLPGQMPPLMERIRADRDIVLLTAPRLTTFPAQLASVIVANQVAYIADFDFQHADGTTVADPVVDTVSYGLLMELLGLPLPGRPDLLVDVDVRLTDLRRPMQSIELAFGARVQLPEVLETRSHVQLAMPDGGSLVLLQPSRMQDSASDGMLMVVLTCRSAALDSESGK